MDSIKLSNCPFNYLFGQVVLFVGNFWFCYNIGCPHDLVCSIGLLSLSKVPMAMADVVFRYFQVKASFPLLVKYTSISHTGHPESNIFYVK